MGDPRKQGPKHIAGKQKPRSRTSQQSYKKNQLDSNQIAEQINSLLENACIDDAYKLAVQSISNAASADLLDLCQEVCSDYGDLANCARAL